MRPQPGVRAIPEPTLTYDDASGRVRIIDQTRLPGELLLVELASLDAFCDAISAMRVRGAPLIGVTAAYGLALAIRAGVPARQAADALRATRPTAVNLAWALQRVLDVSATAEEPAAAALECAHAIAREDSEACRRIGEQGKPLLEALAGEGPVNVLTHCNAGRLATLEWGTATSPIYLAHQEGMDIHVWVSETRPRNQGSSLTAWELAEAGVPFTVVADNACGPLMQSGRVDCVLLGSDRTAANGDVCNKVGTYLKALLAREHGLPFYVALPMSTIDYNCSSGAEIPIEERAAEEVLMSSQGEALSVAGATAWNPAFDVTPANLVTRIITERGVVPASAEGLRQLLAGA